MICRTLEEALQQSEDVTRLELAGRGIQSLADIPWARFKQLRHLNLDKNDIRTLSKRLLGLKQLRTLHLSHNRLRILPAWLDEFSSLRHLHLNENRLSRIDGLPPRLEAFFAARNKLNHWPEALQTRPSLLNLQLDGNPLTTIDSELIHLKDLRELSLADCRLQQIETLPLKLFSLDVSDNRLQQLPENWGQLSGLYRVSLSRNKELSLSLAQFTRLPQLSVLRINRCRYDFTLKELLEAIPHLEEWDVGQRRSEPADVFFQETSIPEGASVALWWQLYQGEPLGKVSAMQLQNAFAQTHDIRIRLSAQRWLLQHFRGSTGDLRKAVWSIQGQTITPAGQLQERLEQQGVRFSAGVTDHRILGYQWSESECSNAQDFLDERTIIRWLDQQEKKPWSRSIEPTEVQSMGQLLSGLPVHVGIPHPGWPQQMAGRSNKDQSPTPEAWLQWLQTSGVPDVLLPDLLEKTIYLPAYCEQLAVYFPYLPPGIQLLLVPLLEGKALRKWFKPRHHRRELPQYLPPARFLGQGLAGKLLRQIHSWDGVVDPGFWRRS